MAEEKEEEHRSDRTASTTTTSFWGTWEELLLASAVKRHGFKDWDSVAMEVQVRSSLPNLHTTAHDCELKYRDLKRRFCSPQSDAAVEENATLIGGEVDNIPWLDELRRLRVAELRQELQRYDVSILSLQTKVKRLEEERERSLNEKEIGEDKPDLDEEEPRERRSENDKNGSGEPDRSEPERTDEIEKVAVPREEEDFNREDQSVNESNSTGSKIRDGRTSKENTASEIKPESVHSDGPEQVRGDAKSVGADSDNGSSDTVAKNTTCDIQKPGREKKEDESSVLPDSTAQSNEGEEGTRDSSEVQSSASLTRKKKRNKLIRNEISGGSSSDDPPFTAETVNSQQLDEVLRIMRAHKHISLFESRLKSQEKDEYKNLVRQHMDLETIQARLQKGSYSSSTHAFYRDLLLLLNNALTFFPKSSLESTTARQLRNLISNIMKKGQQLPTTPGPSPEATDSSPVIPAQPKSLELQRSDSLLAKHKSSAPIIVCRKRSSISAKPSSAGLKAEQDNDEKKSNFELKPPGKPSSNVGEEHGGLAKDSKVKDKSVTGTRSMRRSNDNATDNSNPSVKKQNTSDSSKAGSVNKVETSKTDKKKTEAVAMEKKRSAADFLKRIKRNSPAEVLKSSARGGGNNNNNNSDNNSSGAAAGGEQKKKGGSGSCDKGKVRVLRQSTSDRKHSKEDISPSKRSVGRPPKKAVESNSGSTKRAREGGGKEAAKRPKKRTRR